MATSGSTDCFKICLLTWKAVHKVAPVYIQDLLIKYEPAYENLRSNDKNLLVIPKTSLKTYGDRAFSFAAPTLWNGLPDHIRLCDNIDTFKTLLKTHLYSVAYNC